MLRLQKSFPNMKFLKMFSTLSHHYKVLGLSPGVSKDDIRRAYFEKAKACHPDLFPSDDLKTKEFQSINEAYQELMNLGNNVQHISFYDQKSDIYDPPSVQTASSDGFEQFLREKYVITKAKEKTSDSRMQYEAFKKLMILVLALGIPPLFVMFFGTNGVLHVPGSAHNPVYNRYLQQSDASIKKSDSHVQQLLAKYDRKKSNNDSVGNKS